MSFLNQRVEISYLYPTAQDVFESDIISVDDSVELNNSGQLTVLYDIDLFSNGIIFSFDPNKIDGKPSSGNSRFSFDDLDFNGLSFFDIDDTIPDIIGIRVSSRDLSDLDFQSSDVTFDADTIFLNLAGVTLVQSPTEQSVITIDVNFAAPVAQDDTGQTALLTAVDIAVLTNDSDDGTLDPASVTVATGPANGTATANPDGTVTYTPNFLFVGADSFTYTVDDDFGVTSNEATVDVTVELGRNLVTGSSSGDFRIATNSGDLVQTLAGNDTVFARGGDDIVLGGAGGDSLFGDNGDDLLFGGAGGDALMGGNGLDILVGGPGNDSLVGGGGLDTAIFAGNYTDHRVSGFGTFRTVEDLAGDGGRDGLTSVELLQFDDGFFDARNGQFTEGAFATAEVEALVTSPGFTTDPEPLLAPVV